MTPLTQLHVFNAMHASPHAMHGRMPKEPS